MVGRQKQEMRGRGEIKKGRQRERYCKGNASTQRTCNYDPIEKLANAAFRERINATDRLSPIIKVLKQQKRCERIYARINDTRASVRPRPTTLRRCSSGLQPDVSPVSGRAFVGTSFEKSSRPLSEPAPFFADILCPRNPLFLLLPQRRRTMAWTLVIGQQIRSGIR